ncbi:hypothetical protein EZY14_009370 [Kordia sp. TARA_039_SRF]|nr:hypothetical protein EZY14_009370 [Kordia sp. TARA_039_SRF]
MRKIKIFAILFLIASTTIAQHARFNKRVKMLNVPQGEPTDSVLVLKSNGLVRYVKQSDLSTPQLSYSNGLNQSNGVVSLGGTLTADTVIDGDYELELGGSLLLQRELSVNSLINYNGVNATGDIQNEIVVIGPNNTLYKSILTIDDLQRQITPSVNLVSYTPRDGELFRDANEQNTLKFYNGGIMYKVMLESLEDLYGVALSQANNSYIAYEDYAPQPNVDFTAKIVFKPQDISAGSQLVLLSRFGGTTGICLQIKNPLLSGDPTELVFQFGDASNIIVRNIDDLILGDVYTLEIGYSGRDGAFSKMKINGVSVLENAGGGNSTFDKNYNIDYTSSEFTSRNINSLYSNIFAGIPSTPDIRGSFDLFEMTYAFGVNNQIFEIEENTGITTESNQGVTADLLGTVQWVNKN